MPPAPSVPPLLLLDSFSLFSFPYPVVLLRTTHLFLIGCKYSPGVFCFVMLCFLSFFGCSAFCFLWFSRHWWSCDYFISFPATGTSYWVFDCATVEFFRSFAKSALLMVLLPKEFFWWPRRKCSLRCFILSSEASFFLSFFSPRGCCTFLVLEFSAVWNAAFSSFIASFPSVVTSPEYWSRFCESCGALLFAFASSFCELLFCGGIHGAP